MNFRVVAIVVFGILVAAVVIFLIRTSPRARPLEDALDHAAPHHDLSAAVLRQPPPTAVLVSLSGASPTHSESQPSLVEFNTRFHKTLGSRDPATLRALLDEYRSLINGVQGKPSPEAYNAGCYFGSLIQALHQHGALTSKEITEWSAFLAERVRNQSVDEEYRSALLWSAQDAGIQSAVSMLAREMLALPDASPDSHMARRSVGVLLRSGIVDDRNIALQYATHKKGGAAVEAVVGYLAEQSAKDCAHELVRLKHAGVQSKLYGIMDTDTVKGVAAIIASGTDADIEGAFSLAASAVYREVDKTLCIDALCGLVSATSKQDAVRQRALKTLIQMTEYTGLEAGQKMLSRVRSTVESDPLFADAKAHVIEICESQIVK